MPRGSSLDYQAVPGAGLGRKGNVLGQIQRRIDRRLGHRHGRPGSKGSVTHTRFVAQDVTVKRLLEAELQEKNQRLAEANDELSQRNRELDEFVYVVSHDLQEPLRTLIAFSDFLLKDYGDRLEAEGQEYVRYLVDASRRMRAMIHGLLNLSRAGKVIGEFAMVDLEELTAVDQDRPGRAFPQQKRRVAGQGSAARRLGRPRPNRAATGKPDQQRHKIQPELEPVGRGRSNADNRRRLAG